MSARDLLNAWQEAVDQAIEDQAQHELIELELTQGMTLASGLRAGEIDYWRSERHTPCCQIN